MSRSLEAVMRLAMLLLVASFIVPGAASALAFAPGTASRHLYDYDGTLLSRARAVVRPGTDLRYVYDGTRQLRSSARAASDSLGRLVAAGSESRASMSPVGHVSTAWRTSVHAGACRLAPNTTPGTSIVRYDPDFAVSQLTRNFDAKASQLADFGAAQGWKPVQSATGPLGFVDENGIFRLTIKQGSPRTPGSGLPHVEIRNAAGQRIDAFGNPVTRRSPGNHTPIVWDLP